MQVDHFALEKAATEWSLTVHSRQTTVTETISTTIENKVQFQGNFTNSRELGATADTARNLRWSVGSPPLRLCKKH